jgi:hypothetical protein
MSEHYFTFPLAVLWGEKPHAKVKNPPPITPFQCIDLAVDCGMVGAGKGFRKNHTEDEFLARLDEACEEIKVVRKDMMKDVSEVVVGSRLCGVDMLGSKSHSRFQETANRANGVPHGGPLVRMASKYLWAAHGQAKAEADPSSPWPERGISWREFRILCAILSAKTNRAGFAFIGWEVIQARACGFTTKEAFKDADNIPDHLAPPLTHKMIRKTCDALEDLGFYARFRFSTGKTGGLMAYSFRHTREELAKAVCDSANFRDRAKIKANREADTQKCLELLERAKVGQRVDKQ